MDTVATSPPAGPSTQTAGDRAGLLPEVAGTLVGLPFAGLSLYWAFGGTRFVAGYGESATGRVGSVGVLCLLVGVLMPVGFVLVLIGYDARARTPVRWLAWMSAGWMALAGFALTVLFGLLALAGSSGVEPGTEHLLRRHAFGRDPYLATGRELF